MNKPNEHEYTSQVAYTRALEKYCAYVEGESNKVRIENGDVLAANNYLADCFSALMHDYDQLKKELPKKDSQTDLQSKDCRLCDNHLSGFGRCYFEANDTGVCINGDRFEPMQFTPLWEVT